MKINYKERDTSYTGVGGEHWGQTYNDIDQQLLILLHSIHSFVDTTVLTYIQFTIKKRSLTGCEEY